MEVGNELLTEYSTAIVKKTVTTPKTSFARRAGVKIYCVPHKVIQEILRLSGGRDAYVRTFNRLLSGVLTVSRSTAKIRRARRGMTVIVLAEGRLKSGLSPAANYRVYKVRDTFIRRGVRWVIVPAVPSKYFVVNVKHGWIPARIHRDVMFLVEKSLIVRRYIQLAWYGPVADIMVLQRELCMTPSPGLELFARAVSKNLVFDFDDALFAQQPWHDLGDSVMLETWRFQRRKVDRILSMVDGVITSNEYLADYARKWNDQVIISPTPVDTGLFCPTKRGRLPGARDSGVISWIGTSANLVYVRPILDCIMKVIRDIAPKWRFVIICNDLPACEIRVLRQAGAEFKVWRVQDEIRYFQETDIGIMPLRDDKWSRGKMGYKLLQYLSCAVPVVASPVGFNMEIVKSEWGCLARTEGEWYQCLRALVDDPDSRKKMGMKGRHFVEENFGLNAYVDPTEKLFRELLS